MGIPLLYDYFDDDDDDNFSIMGRGFVPFARRDMSHGPDEKGSQLVLLPKKKDKNLTLDSSDKEDAKKEDEKKEEEKEEEPEEIFVDLNKK